MESFAKYVGMRLPSEPRVNVSNMIFVCSVYVVCVCVLCTVFTNAAMHSGAGLGRTGSVESVGKYVGARPACSLAG